MDPVERTLIGIGGDAGGLLGLLGNPVVAALAWILPIAAELLLAAWAYRAWRRRRNRIEAAAWAEPGCALPPDARASEHVRARRG